MKKILHKLPVIKCNLLIIFSTLIFIMMSCSSAHAQESKLYVRIAKIVVDSAKLENYKAALKLQAETAVRIEPGVLTLYAVYNKENSTHVTVFEIYANMEAYKLHIQTPHFKKYKNTVEKMVKSLELIDVIPIALETKPR